MPNREIFIGNKEPKVNVRKRTAVARLFLASRSRSSSARRIFVAEEKMMARVSAEKRAELEGFWRSHHEGWKNSPLNQREYCELHGLPLSRFGNWRDQFKIEDEVHQAGLLYRRGGLSHMTSHMTDRENGPVSTGYIPSGQTLPEARRNFRLPDKKRRVAEAMAPGASDVKQLNTIVFRAANPQAVYHW